MGDERLKSAYELAMERLRKDDEASGVERRPVTEAQKAAIAEIRNFYEAKLAEVELLHQGKLWTTADPAERAVREEEYRRDRERLSNEREKKIEKIRRGRSVEIFRHQAVRRARARAVRIEPQDRVHIQHLAYLGGQMLGIECFWMKCSPPSRTPRCAMTSAV